MPGVAEDRISDITASILKGFLLRFSREKSQQYDVPTRLFSIANVYDPDKKLWQPGIKTELPYNPLDVTPLILAPLDWLRHLPWINYQDYYRSYYMPYVLPPDLARSNTRQILKEKVLAYNRANYVSVQRYVDSKERQANQCKPDPLFEPLRLDTLRRMTLTRFRRVLDGKN